MSEHRTSSIAKNIFGNSLYQIRARSALPILVRQALASEKISYGDLAKELDMPNARNLNWVLGSIGKTLLELGEKWQEEIPPIQGIVVGQQTGLPGDGVNFIIGKLDPRQKEAIVQEKLGSVFSYPRWLDVLEACELSPAKPLNPPEPPDHRSRTRESEAHKRFKNYIARYPEAVGLKKSLAPGETEHKLPSGDIPDVLFQSARCRIAVEVKSRISSEDDLRRGLFQCIKYRAILRACRSLEGGTYEADALLAIEGSLPKELIPVKNTLGVKVFEIK
ncbi:MAG: hypothetical protein OXT69_10330 [Candidatus Poribacteria bacterium]|nr:hypothetical protein [Candidatus Poribacteria bacterium]